MVECYCYILYPNFGNNAIGSGQVSNPSGLKDLLSLNHYLVYDYPNFYL